MGYVGPVGLLSLLLGLLAWVALRIRARFYLSSLPFPPGPKPLPIIGNLLDMPTKNMAPVLHEMAKKYGSLSFHSPRIFRHLTRTCELERGSNVSRRINAAHTGGRLVRRGVGPSGNPLFQHIRQTSSRYGGIVSARPVASMPGSLKHWIAALHIGLG